MAQSKGDDKAKGGRPTKYEPRYCDMVIEDMGKGYSLTAFAGLIGVNRDTIHAWTKDHTEFSEAVSRAKALRLRDWETVALSMRTNGGGPGGATITVFGLKNMGGDEWADISRTESKVESKVEVSPDAAFADFVERLESVARSATANTTAPSGMDGDGSPVPTGPSGK